MVDSLLDDKKGKTGATRMNARLTRSIVLGCVAVGFGIYWLADSYEVDMAELFDYLKTSMAFVAFFAFFGILAGLVLWLIRMARRR